MVRRFLLLPCLTIALGLSCVLPVQADELIVPAQADPSVQVTGLSLTSATAEAGTGSGHLFRCGGTGAATVFWPFPSSLAAGPYEVFARWRSGPDRAMDATYGVASDNATQAVPKNQQTNGDSWQSPGVFS